MVELRTFVQDLLEEEMDEVGSVTAEDLKTSIRGDTETLNKLADIGIVTNEKGLLSLCDKMSREGKDRINIEYFVNTLTNLHGNAQASFVVDTKYEIVKIGCKISRFEKKWTVFADKMFPNKNVLAPTPREEPAAVVVKTSDAPPPKKRSSLKGAPGGGLPGTEGKSTKQMRFSNAE